QGQVWVWDEVQFEILHPANVVAEKKNRVKDNDTSCVLRIAGVGGSAVVFGDIEKASEARLVSEQRIAQTDVAIVPHHGSRTSSTASLVLAVRARYALIGAGIGNRWGFPKPDVLARWRESGAATFVTAQSGAIDVAVDGRGVQAPSEYRANHPRYWRIRSVRE
ncbi:MAG: hypothetical protein H7Y02_01960, partial [Candidatus Obscuribacterales bacterium]|nr:hypothetical protein [Steroidobacteraceae bacterium]